MLTHKIPCEVFLYTLYDMLFSWIGLEFPRALASELGFDCSISNTAGYLKLLAQVLHISNSMQASSWSSRLACLRWWAASWNSACKWDLMRRRLFSSGRAQKAALCIPYYTYHSADLNATSFVCGLDGNDTNCLVSIYLINVGGMRLASSFQAFWLHKFARQFIRKMQLSEAPGWLGLAFVWQQTDGARLQGCFQPLAWGTANHLRPPASSYRKSSLQPPCAACQRQESPDLHTSLFEDSLPPGEAPYSRRLSTFWLMLKKNSTPFPSMLGIE